MREIALQLQRQREGDGTRGSKICILGGYVYIIYMIYIYIYMFCKICFDKTYIKVKVLQEFWSLSTTISATFKMSSMMM
jgi:hypothetical protein